MRNNTRHSTISALGLTVCLIAPCAYLFAQTAPPKPAAPPKPPPDVLILSDDERLVGHFERSNGGTVTFKSDVLGELTIPWPKVKELQASGTYIVFSKETKLARRSDTSTLPQGSIAATDKDVTVTAPAPGAKPTTVPVANAAHIIESTEFEKQVVETPGIGQDWAGSINAGVTVVAATQTSQTYTGGFALVRAVPTEAWLDPSNRTTVAFNATSGTIKQPGVPEVKTDIIHGALERDEYFGGDGTYGFAQATFDHNYAQGLDLAAQVGAGIGWTAIKNSNNVLDVKADMTYLHQSFLVTSSGPPTPDKSLVGTNFAQDFTHHFAHGIVLAQTLSMTPTWNPTSDWMGNASVTLTVPAYKRLNVALSAVDSYLNDPAPGFKKNSLQLTAGLAYTLK